MYKLLRSLLFCLPPETAHGLTLKTLQLLYQLKLTKLFFSQKQNPIECMGLKFPNRVGLAAGFDKNGDYIDALASLGFGFIEIGTVTPKPQPGNPKPRLFRLPQEEALINRMGFNNKGMDYVAARLQKTNYKGILGINIGKNAATPIADAMNDYLIAFQRLNVFASYMVINISSPNTEGLRDLQHGELLKNLLSTLKHEQSLQKKYVPLVVKISPDLSDEELSELASVLLSVKMDGVIATNTQLNSNGGLSGKPLSDRSTYIIKKLNSLLQNKIPIIASGGVMDTVNAQEKIAAGAHLLQVYTGLIYQGPSLIKLLV